VNGLKPILIQFLYGIKDTEDIDSVSTCGSFDEYPGEAPKYAHKRHQYEMDCIHPFRIAVTGLEIPSYLAN
jgi:hypothetical protein